MSGSARRAPTLAVARMIVRHPHARHNMVDRGVGLPPEARCPARAVQRGRPGPGRVEGLWLRSVQRYRRCPPHRDRHRQLPLSTSATAATRRVRPALMRRRSTMTAAYVARESPSLMRSVTTSSSQAQPARWDDLVATIDAEDRFRPRDSRVARQAAARILAGRLHRSCSPAQFEGTAALILGSQVRIIDRRGHLTVMREHGLTEALVRFPSPTGWPAIDQPCPERVEAGCPCSRRPLPLVCC
jgi:hypothetical protein